MWNPWLGCALAQQQIDRDGIANFLKFDILN